MLECASVIEWYRMCKNKIFIQNDKIIEDMIKKLGGKVRAVKQTFTPEGGAYGIGRTHSHKH